MEATRCNTSPIFTLYPGDAWSPVEAALDPEPWGKATDADGTHSRVWRVVDPAVHEAVSAALADAELLIADGHHRYETARTYADAIGGEGPHRYTLMCLVSLQDPGLTVFPTHRLIRGLDAAGRESLEAGLRKRFELRPVPSTDADPGGSDGIGVFGYLDAGGKGHRLRLRDPAELDRAIPNRPDSFRRLDSVILEHIVLRGILGMSEDDIATKRGLAYASSIPAVNAAIESGEASGAFLLRPTPIEQVREVAGAGETMPPKSTYFFPKVPTGIAFNPLS